jgi:hypothetical protein
MAKPKKTAGPRQEKKRGKGAGPSLKTGATATLALMSVAGTSPTPPTTAQTAAAHPVANVTAAAAPAVTTAAPTSHGSDSQNSSSAPAVYDASQHLANSTQAADGNFYCNDCGNMTAQPVNNTNNGTKSKSGNGLVVVSIVALFGDITVLCFSCARIISTACRPHRRSGQNIPMRTIFGGRTS